MKSLFRTEILNTETIHLSFAQTGPVFTTARNNHHYTAMLSVEGWHITTTQIATGKKMGMSRFYATIDDLQVQCKAFAALGALIRFGCFDRALNKQAALIQIERTLNGHAHKKPPYALLHKVVIV